MWEAHGHLNGTWQMWASSEWILMQKGPGDENYVISLLLLCELPQPYTKSNGGTYQHCLVFYYFPMYTPHTKGSHINEAEAKWFAALKARIISDNYILHLPTWRMSASWTLNAEMQILKWEQKKSKPGFSPFYWDSLQCFTELKGMGERTNHWYFFRKKSMFCSFIQDHSKTRKTHKKPII